jgi:hypothetical protein
MRSSYRQLFLTLTLFVAMGVRSLIPVGYMPGDVFAGEFMVMCPGSSAAALAGIHDHHHEDDSVDIDRACPIGSALIAIALPMTSAWSMDVDRVAESFVFTATEQAARLTVGAYRSRAPPQV